MHFQIPKQDILAQLIHQLENYFLLDDMEKTIINGVIIKQNILIDI